MHGEPIGHNPNKEPAEVTHVIRGGSPLEGSVDLTGAKNFALQALVTSVITDEPLVLGNFPDIKDTRTNLGILAGMGAEIKTRNGEVTIDTSGVDPTAIRPEDTVQTTGSRYFIPAFVTRFGSIQAGPPGGDQIGATDRFKFNPGMLMQYQQIGIGSREVTGSDGRTTYEFFEPPRNQIPEELVLDKRYFGPTIQALLRFSGSEHDFTLTNPNIEPEVGYTIGLLQEMGADIEYVQEGFEKGQDQIRIKGKGKLKGAGFPIFSDPNALVTYAVMGLITNGEIAINGVDHNPKVDAFIEILKAMDADFSYDSTTLHIHPSRNRLQPVNLVTDFWPAQCHTDWQQILTPLLSTIDGQSTIDENVYPSRFTSVDTLRIMGADIRKVNDPSRLTNQDLVKDGNPHSLVIQGGSKFYPATTRAPQDVRGATGIMAAMLSAEGNSVLFGANQIHRGVEDIDLVLKSLGAQIA